MIVKIGWNTDFGKEKFDVGLDEIDLARILEEAGIPPDAKLTSAEAFTILLAEGERFSQHVLATRTKDDAAAEQARQASVSLADRLFKVKVRLGLEQPAGV
jgi:hypothetical protein